MQVPLLSLKNQYEQLRTEIKKAIDEVLESQYFILGPKVLELEQKFAEYCGSRYAVGVSSGTDALIVALLAKGIGNGDEVITTPYSFFATAGSISRVGATPVFADIDPVTYNIDPGLIEEKITPKTKAIIPVHIFGQCVQMDPVIKIARKHDLCVIEDAAQAVGATQQSKKAGSIGDMGCFSFYVSKNLGAFGEAGMVTTDDEELYDKCKKLRCHGENERYYNEMIGGNFRMDAIQAAVLLVKFPFLDGWTNKRRENAEAYNKLLSGIPVKTPVETDGNYMIYNQYVIATDRRDALMEFLKSAGISTKIYYPVPIAFQTCYESLSYSENDLPNSTAAAKTSLALPIYPELTDEQIQYVARKIREFFNK